MLSFIIYGVLLGLFIVYIFIYGKFQFSLFSMFFLIYLLFYGPTFFTYHFDLGIDTYAIRTANMLSVFISFFAIGFISINAIYAFLKKNTSYKKWYAQTLVKTNSINPYILIPFAVLSLMVMFMGLFFYDGISALKEAIFDNNVNAVIIRELRAGSGVKGWILPFFVYNNTLFDRIISFLLLAYAYQNKKKLVLIFAYFYCLFALLCAFSSLQKITGIYYLLQLAIFHFLFFNKKINFKRILIIGSLVVGLLIFIYIYTTGAENSGQALELIGFRIFGEPNRVLKLYAEYWPDKWPFTYGMNIRAIYSIFNSSESPFVPSNIRLPEDFGAINASFDSFFVADAWVDFGYIGIALQSLFVGLYISFLDNWLFQIKSTGHIALIAAMVLSAITLANLGLITTLIGFGFLTFPLIYYLFNVHIKSSQAQF